MKKFAVAAALALLFVWTPDAQAQDMTVASYVGSWTPIGQLPAGVRHVTKNSQKAEFVMQVQTNKPQGQMMLGGQAYPWKLLGSQGGPPVDSFSFGMELQKDYWVSCTVAKREADGSRYSGLCWDEAQREGWINVQKRAGEVAAPQPAEGRPDSGR